MTLHTKNFVASLARCAIAALTIVVETLPAMSQELEPRSYSPSPIGTNFFLSAISNSTGQVSLDPSLPLSDVRASVSTAAVGFQHTFAFAGRTASWGIKVPYLGANISAAFYGQTQQGTRYGFPDLQARLGIELLGRALTPSEFARRKPSTTLGISLTVAAPTGTYDSTHLINVGSNRWAFKPEVGFEQPMGKWFADLSGGMWIFRANTDYVGGGILQQAPLAIFQVHTGCNFRAGQWLALDANYYSGGSTRVNGATAINELANSRYGLTFSQPFGTNFSTRLSWSRWLSGHYGQNFSTATLTLQYRWFDRRDQSAV